MYARSSGAVWVIFGCKAGVSLKRWQAVQVVGGVWWFMLDYGPREVRGAEVLVEGVEGGVGASFSMRFFEAGEGVGGG